MNNSTFMESTNFNDISNFLSKGYDINGLYNVRIYDEEYGKFSNFQTTKLFFHIIANHDHKIIEFLCKNGANPNISNEDINKNCSKTHLNYMKTPLMHVCQKGNVKYFNILIKYCKNVKDGTLCYAIYGNNLEFIKRLINKGAKFDNSCKNLYMRGLLREKVKVYIEKNLL